VDQPYVERGFLVGHEVNAFVFSLSTILIVCLALFPGIGYTANVQASQRNIISGPHLSGSGYAVNRLFNGTINAYFNPIIYPISYLSGCNSVLRRFTGASEFWDHEGTQVQEAAMLGTLFVEFLKNIPYFLAVGILSSAVLARLSKVPRIAEFYEIHIQEPVKTVLGRMPEENSTLADWTKERMQTKRKLVRRVIAIPLIISAFALAYIGIVFWNMFWPVFLLTTVMIIVGAILF